MTSQERLIEIKNYAEKHGKQEACNFYNITESSLERYCRELKERPETNQTELSDEQTEKERVLTARSANITSLDELLKYSKVDLSKWQVSRHIINTWEVTTGEGKTYTNYQVKAWLEAKKTETIDDIIESFRKQAENYSPKYPQFIRKKQDDGVLLELSIPDFHLGQLSWGKETGRENYDVKIAYSLFIDATEYLIDRTSQFNIDRIFFPIGNDFFNVNSAMNTTFAGTLQDEDCRWQKSFTYGREMAVEAVDRMSSVADVTVVVIPGNHDYEKSFYLGEALKAWYRNCKNVTVDNSPMIKKYYDYGNTLIGYTHGDKMKHNDLPLIMATDVPDKWAKTKYREFHVGHLHRKSMNEFRQVRVEVLSSLAPISAWAANAGYDHLREATAQIYDKERGKIAVVNYRPEE